MEKDKSRGLKHLKNKMKYKGNSTKNEKYVPPKSQPNLESNWDRYNWEETDPHKLTSSTDFSILAETPISRGNYFQFKSDKNNLSDENDMKNTNLLSLNMGLLESCILTVPFHKRLGLADEYFTHKELRDMEKSSFENKKLFEERVKALNEDKIKKNPEPSPTRHDSDKDADLPIIEKAINSLGKNEPAVIAKSAEKKDEDLEEWLDNILDD